MKVMGDFNGRDILYVSGWELCSICLNRFRSNCGATQSVDSARKKSLFSARNRLFFGWPDKIRFDWELYMKVPVRLLIFGTLL